MRLCILLELGSTDRTVLLSQQVNCKILQEWWGINEDIKEKAMMLHQTGGCRVFIPDIFKGKTTLEVAEAKHVRPPAEVLLVPACCCPTVSACCLNPPASLFACCCNIDT